ncbi:MAG: substrate-binding domain-containing protein [Candidatus Hydrogenedens sp.]|nr:substrate-binding domain-containing protein [Candidatus Hydrogenedentota bacterium]NLF59107.1 substrate-binding domain-containing protein [Candidatus Hydrogenedens sp.]
MRSAGHAARLLNEHRALLILAALFALLSAAAPNFLSVDNVTAILKGASLNAVVAVGFTLVLILGQLDLSIGAVVMLCGMLTVGLQPSLGWPGCFAVALAAGGLVGLVNGWLVVRARINSFIVTLGTMTIVTGLMHLYSGGGSKSIDDFRLADWLARPLLPFMPPSVLLTLLLVAGFSVFLNRTRTGRNFFLVGANPEAAWLAGLNRDRYLMAGFVLCGLTAAAGGALFAAGLSAMTSAAVLGARTLMTVLAAVIIGGTLMSGGAGGVFKSYFAVLLLTVLFNGIGCFGLGFEVQIFVNGLILAVVVLGEAYALHRHALLRGRRPDLMRGVAEGNVFREAPPEGPEAGVSGMNDKNRLAIVCMTLAALVAMTAVTAMYFRHAALQAQLIAAGGYAAAPQPSDVYALRGTDNQPYLFPPEGGAVDIPERPANPAALPETDRGHWWDIEYAGWRVDKEPMPPSPGDGPSGKRVILLKAGDHPYWTAYVRGFTNIARFHRMRVKVFNGNWNMDLQAQQADQAINERPDMIILAPVDATGCTPLLRRIHRAGIPCVTSNTIPCDEAMKYCLAWTGPDDWGQFRMLARVFADALGKEGGYAVIRHMPGSSPFFSRTFAPVTELGEYAPGMKLLAMDTTNLEAELSMQLVGAWLAKFGPELKGIVLAGDDFPLTGTLEALKKAGRDDVVLVAAGNSKTGMDSVRDGKVLAISYQSAEGDGALAVHSAARWFDGETLDPVVYLPKHIITRADVENFMPAQW